ncbi:flavin reductase family protein [Planosporangium mesophilum]|uniref:Oxidoreductase n=1 Tax=Planosporangium mesophilum TaxID=689768 RepID=A0A8J3THU3_9ACTN|nr:flavin reductase family protein [Planosporangium mesophilum]GII25796.1 oxidoreductase [Planosporangium mesophilum]
MGSDRDLDPFLAGLDYPMFVVTAVHRDTGVRAGCLVGFATQSSLGPDRFLVCLSQNNFTYRVATYADVLAVHAPAATQRDLAALFGTRTGDEVDKFARCAWRPGPSGVPLLDDCPRRFVGEVLERVPLGNHTGFLLSPIEVTGDATADGKPTGRPLMFSDVADLDAGHPA